MSNHHGREFIGFTATSPPMFLPEFIWTYICCPKPRVDKLGRPREAPYGLRKIEASLIESGFKASIIDPDYVFKYLKKAKAVLIGHHDFFAYGPPSSEWWLITGKVPVNRRLFTKFMNKLSSYKKKYGFKILVGGPAAWQWQWESDKIDLWGVDTVVDGEADIAIKKLAQKILDSEPLPKYIYIGVYDSPKVNQIPVIKGASVNGLVEIMRGCPRGCSFCSVTLRPLRHIPLEVIEKEIEVNTASGVTSGIFHSEDVLLYGTSDVIPSEEPLRKLHEMSARHLKSIAWAHVSLAAVVVAERQGRILSKITDIIYSKLDQDYIGVEVGIESGSPKLAEKIMPGKSAPFPPSKYPEIVEEAFSIMHEHKIVPAATFILNMPGETPEDVVKTIELIERLRSYRSIIVPMIFVPLGRLKGARDVVAKVRITREHVEAMKAALDHSLIWSERIINEFYLKEREALALRLFLKYFMKIVRWKANSLYRSLEDFVEKEFVIAKL
ncbi:MAG: radical SAM protein [Sulfolobales archaeon]|nr:B12-binding domain-containing radical SAM protein [Sulfolobales archaeon]MDW8083242.1 radical SAM protein [Sulfolobales archaeon]